MNPTKPRAYITAHYPGYPTAGYDAFFFPGWKTCWIAKAENGKQIAIAPTKTECEKRTRAAGYTPIRGQE